MWVGRPSSASALRRQPVSQVADSIAANATDYEKLTSLGAELRAAQAEKADLEDRWLAVAADLDA